MQLILYWLTEFKKPGYNASNLHDNVDIDITKLSVQSSLKCFITEINENKDLLTLLLCHAEHNSKPLYFESGKK